MLVEVVEQPQTVIPASEMKVGQIGRAVTGIYIQHIVLRTYYYWVSLNNPGFIWTAAGFQVQLLNPGTIIKLTVE